MESRQEIVMIIILLTLLFSLGQIRAYEGDCPTKKCSESGPDIKFPFRLKDQPLHCGYPGFELTCKDGNTTIQLPSVGEVSLADISYYEQIIDIYDPNDCLAGLILWRNLSSFSSSSPSFHYQCLTHNYTFLNCSVDDTIHSHEHIYPVDCLNRGDHQIFVVESSFDMAFLPDSCNTIRTVAVPDNCYHYRNYRSRPSFLGYDDDYFYYNYQPVIGLKWEVPGCSDCSVARYEKCGFKNKTTGELGCIYQPDAPYPYFIEPDTKGTLAKRVIIGVTVGVFVLIVATIVSVKFYLSWKFATKKERDNQLKVDKFLDDYKCLKPTRYSYADIKKMTNQFKTKLGQGGYGSVFEGKLVNGILVAVKILKESIGDGAEFINEVGTIGRIHHVNVVRLLGYCADGYKRALIYEFMSNGSLDKFIFLKDAQNPLLGWEKLQDIAIGIAKGMEYLHQGCDQRILHFDIKPHNILLDHNYNPKISDFGLAKLYPKGQSIVSMTATRGTMGYIAPEVFSRNFGNVSSKSDVYSFGMLLLEMVGGRKNIDATVEQSSQVYFPEWIYNRLHQGEDLELKIATDGDAKIAKRLTIVATWCIQWYPASRPCMKSAVQMLEGSVEGLAMPPNPFASTVPPETDATFQRDQTDGSKLTVIAE